MVANAADDHDRADYQKAREANRERRPKYLR
jgi:hypothetical protein